MASYHEHKRVFKLLNFLVLDFPSVIKLQDLVKGSKNFLSKIPQAV